jgi:arylsulfatase A-like enzyme
MLRTMSMTLAGAVMPIAWQAGQRSAFIVALLAVFCGVGQAAAINPNIVVILADDLGYGDVSCYNALSKVPTPCIDRLAREGMRFTDAHSPSSVCTPTRYALLTGRYAWRSPLKRGVLGPWGTPIIAVDRLTVPALLRQLGYATAAIGKWHLGLNYTTKDGQPATLGADKMSNVDFAKPIADGPITRGFDYYFGVNVPNHPPYCFIENDRSVGIPSVRDGGEADGINMPGPMLPGWKLVDILPELTRRTERWIAGAGKAAKAGKPFFLYLPLTSPHFPVVPAPEFKGKSQAGDYGDFVAQTDDCVGRVLAALEQAGVAENTLVIFTSDNGPETASEVSPGAYDRIHKYQHASMGEWRGVKRDLWEGGHRVPFLARWPGKIPAGAVSDETICHVDLMATIAALLDAKLPQNAGEDSFNFLPVLRGEKHSPPAREVTVHHGFSGRLAIRCGNWVLIEKGTGDDNRGNASEPAWLKKQRGYEPDHSEGQLFNLRTDPAQKTNLYNVQPARVRELQALLDHYRREGRSTSGPAQPNDPALQEPAKPSNQSRR